MQEKERHELEWLRQKYVADAMTDAELELLGRYSELEAAIDVGRSAIVEREKRYLLLHLLWLMP